MKTQFRFANPQPAGFTNAVPRREVARMLRAHRAGKFPAIIRRTPAGYVINGRLAYAAA